MCFVHTYAVEKNDERLKIIKFSGFCVADTLKAMFELNTAAFVKVNIKISKWKTFLCHAMESISSKDLLTNISY